MEKPSTSNDPIVADADLNANPPETGRKNQGWSQFWDNLVRIGLGEETLRIATGVAAVAMILVVVWLMNTFYLKGQITNDNQVSATALAEMAATPTAAPDMPAYSAASPGVAAGVGRLALIHTILPTKPRVEILEYEVLAGDTIFGIAEKFALNPETILFGNYDVLADDPHSLTPGQKLSILPANGTVYKWNDGDSLNKVAEFFKVIPQVIVDWPGNRLSPETIGDYAFPNIAGGTQLFIPGGTREFINWSAPRITRTDPAVAKLLGPGYCGEIYTGLTGDEIFTWPTTNHFLSGYDYSPATNHFGLDFDGDLGSPIFATDSGVVVYSGWNNFGYGNVIVVDHGNGWQSLYAHLEQIYVGCGESVYRGGLIGMMGSTGKSTGPHLHFELRTDHAYVNPWDYLH